MEQKNDSLVRAYFGTVRLDTVEQCAALNALYDQMWWYYNACQPVLHLIEKTALGTRLRRRWDVAQTPLARLLASGVLAAEQAAALQARWEATNPRALRRAIYAERDRLLCEAGRLQVVPSVTERPATGREAAA